MKVRKPVSRRGPCLGCGKLFSKHYLIGLKRWQCSNCKKIVTDKPGHSSYMGVS